MRKYLVAGNWKMNGDSASNARLLAGVLASLPARDNVEVLVCPPFPYLAAARAQLGDYNVALGAQSVSQFSAGAYTGEVAPGMLVDTGCAYVIVGHSERRALYGETNEVVAAKFSAAQVAGLTPILCVGETLDERDAGETEAVIGAQLDAVIDSAGIGGFASAVIAYEPVWAIGTGKTAGPQQAQDVHRYIRGRVAGKDPDMAAAVRILYGGSVKGDNAAGLFAMADIDGGLIGGASLDAAEFLAIVRAAADVRS